MDRVFHERNIAMVLAVDGKGITPMARAFDIGACGDLYDQIQLLW